MRDAAGVFRGPMDEATKRAIGEAQIRHHQRARQLAPPILRGIKRCTGECGEWKDYDLEDTLLSQFTTLKRTLKDGTVTRYPAGKCKRCQADDAAARRAAKGVEGRRERQEYVRQYLADPANRKLVRDYQREYSTARRREQGVVARPARVKPRYASPRANVNAEPWIRYMEPLLSEISVDDRRHVREAKRRGLVDYYVADRILTQRGLPEAMRSLYGDIPNEPGA